MRGSSSPVGESTASPILVGTVALVITIVGVFLSYNANEGLPFVPTYNVTIQVPDAAELVKADEVRVGGARVGQVTTIEAMPAKDGRMPYARVDVALNVDQNPLPADTRVQVRPRSILGSKYLALTPGRSKRGVPEGGTLPLSRAQAVVELDEAFNTFDPETQQGLRGAVGGLGDALAGRGAALNQTIASLAVLLPPTERVLRVLVAPETNLSGFIDGAAATAGALAPVAPALGRLLDEAAVTLRALDSAGGALGETIEQVPPTEIVATRALRRLRPVLADASALARGLRPAAALLPVAARRLDASLAAAIPVLRNTTGKRLGATLASLERFASDPAPLRSARKLRAAMPVIQTFLTVLSPVQLRCNVFGTWARNLASAGSEGDANGTWIRLVPIFGSDQAYQQREQDPDLHLNYYPNEGNSECESGNERYAPGKLVGNPPGSQGFAHDETAPPAGVPELARRVGLYPPAPGGSP